MDLGLRQLGGNIVRTLLRHGVAVLLGLCLSILLARVLGPEGNGHYAVAILLPTMLSTFLNLGIAPANVYFVGQNAVSIKTAFKTSVVLWLALGLVGGTAAAVVVFYQGEAWFPGVPGPLLWLALLAFPAALLQAFLASLLQGVQDFKRFNAILLVAPTVTLLLAVMAVWLLGWGVPGALAAFFCGQVIGLFASLYGLRHYLRKSRGEQDNSVGERYAAKCIGYGWKAHLSNILAFVNYRADIFLLNFLLAPAAAGIYVIAVLIAERTWFLSQAVSTVILPRLSELHREEKKRRELTPLIARWVFVTSLFVAGLLAAVSFPLIRTLFGEEYITAVGALLWLLPGVVLLSGSRVLANDLAARGRPELNLYTALLVFFVNVGINIVLIPRLGINGAAIATSVAYTLNAVLKIWLYARLSKNRWWRPLVFEREDWRLFGLAMATLHFIKRGVASR